MKLIIDVPDDTYKKIIADKYAIYDKMYYSIKNGIPLDNLRTEIEKTVWDDVVVSLDGTDETRIPRLDFDDVLKIIDKYRNEVNE